jgi:uncharacterized membrane protein
MIEIENEGTEKKVITLMANASLTYKNALLFFIGISFVSLVIAIFFCIIGLWPVLPFSGLELMLLGYCLLLTLKRCRRKEVITITGKTIKVERGIEKPEEKEELPMGWVQVKLEKPQYRGHPTKLAIKSHGKRIEIGRFLVESERKTLAEKLQKMLMLPVVS